MDLTIAIKEGLGPLRFDMPVEEVCRLMGPADEVESINNVADEATTVLHYTKEKLTLFFEGSEPRLQCIDIANAASTLLETPVFQLNKQEVARLMVAHQYLEQDMDKEEWGEERLSFLDGNIDFYFDEARLVSISVGK